MKALFNILLFCVPLSIKAQKDTIIITKFESGQYEFLANYHMKYIDSDSMYIEVTLTEEGNKDDKMYSTDTRVNDWFGLVFNQYGAYNINIFNNDFSKGYNYHFPHLSFQSIQLNAIQHDTIDMREENERKIELDHFKMKSFKKDTISFQELKMLNANTIQFSANNHLFYTDCNQIHNELEIFKGITNESTHMGGPDTENGIVNFTIPLEAYGKYILRTYCEGFKKGYKYIFDYQKDMKIEDIKITHKIIEYNNRQEID